MDADVAWILRQLEVVSTPDALLDWEPAQFRLSPGTRLLALMPCALFDRTALFRVQQVAAIGLAQRDRTGKRLTAMLETPMRLAEALAVEWAVP